MFDSNDNIAIVTTVYNDGGIICKLLNSLLCQTDKHFVHYVYDDGSTLPFDATVDSYLKEVNGLYEVKFIKGKNNIGVNKSHEFVFRIVEEKYFCWVDADDWVHHDFVKIIRKNILSNNDIDVFHINSYRFDGGALKRERKPTDSWIPKIAKKAQDQFPYYCLDGERFFHNFVVKKSALLEVNPSLFIYDVNKDKPFWYDAQILFELAICHKSFKLIKKPLSNIVTRSNSVSRSANVSTYNDCKEIGMILNEMIISQENKELFVKLLPFSKERVQLVNMILEGDIKNAKLLGRKHIKFIRDNNYPKSYLILNDYINFLLFRDKFFFAFKIRRWIITLFQKHQNR